MGIAKACGNKRIIILLENQHLLDRSFILGIGLPPRRDKSEITYPDHRDIVKAIRQGEPSVVRATIQASLLGTKDAVIRRVNDLGNLSAKSQETLSSLA